MDRAVLRYLVTQQQEDREELAFALNTMFLIMSGARQEGRGQHQGGGVQRLGRLVGCTATASRHAPSCGVCGAHPPQPAGPKRFASSSPLHAGTLVFLMQAGFAMLCAGHTRGKSTQNVLAKNLVDCVISTVVFYLVG